MKKILYFTADWCGPCTYVKPQMQEISNQVPITFINVDTNTDTVAKYNVKNIPCVILINGTGIEMGRIVGNTITKQSVINLYNK